MTENKMTVRFYKKTSAQLAYVEKLWENNPMLVDKMPGTRNVFINMLLTDYLSIIIKNQDGNNKVTYEDLKKKLLTPKNTQLEELKRNQYHLEDRINAMFYLLLISNKVLAENGGLKELGSMFEYGTPEYKIYHELMNLVDEDNKRLFASVRQKNKQK